jgi:glycosyltransferase involved in cell wall biosynthesis
MEMLMRLGWELSIFALAYDNRQIAALPAEMRALAAGVGERTHPSPRLARVEAPSDPLANLAGNPVEVRNEVMNLYRGQPLKMLEMRAFSDKAAGLAGEMRAKHIGHLHVQYATRTALAGWIIHRLTGIPYSVRVHGPELADRSMVTSQALKGAAFLAAATQPARESLSDQFGAAGRSVVVHYGLDVNVYAARVGILRAEPPFEVICARPLEAGNGLELLVDAFTDLLQEGMPLRLQIIGEGKLRKALQKQIDQMPFKGAVSLPGDLPADERARRLAAADCYIDPLPQLQGQREALPLALFEALACSLPVVATNLPGRSELVRHFETGVLIPPGDRSTLGSGIRDVYNSPAKAARLARAGRELVIKEFDPLVNARLLTSLIMRQR